MSLRGDGIKAVQSHLAVLTCVFLPNPVTGIIVRGDTISLKRNTRTCAHTDGPRPAYVLHCAGKLCKWFIVDELM